MQRYLPVVLYLLEDHLPEDWRIKHSAVVGCTAVAIDLHDPLHCRAILIVGPHPTQVRAQTATGEQAGTILTADANARRRWDLAQPGSLESLEEWVSKLVRGQAD
jgi:hypothetical protein